MLTSMCDGRTQLTWMPSQLMKRRTLFPTSWLSNKWCCLYPHKSHTSMEMVPPAPLGSQPSNSIQPVGSRTMEQNVQHPDQSLPPSGPKPLLVTEPCNPTNASTNLPNTVIPNANPN